MAEMKMKAAAAAGSNVSRKSAAEGVAWREMAAKANEIEAKTEEERNEESWSGSGSVKMSLKIAKTKSWNSKQ